MATHSALTIRLVGGHPALDFLNTVDPDRPLEDRDVLRCFGDDVAWAIRAGILGTSDGGHLLELEGRSVARACQAHAELLGARDVVRAVVRAEVEAVPSSPAVAAEFEQAVSAALAHRRFSIGQSLGWHWMRGDIDTIRHRLILAAADLLADRTRRPLSVCAGPDCGWYFLDTSKSGNRRWCSDAACGTASRVRKLRQREVGGKP